MSHLITVTLVTVAATKDRYGNTIRTETTAEYDRVRFAPRSSAERNDPHAPGVITGATLYRRGDFPVFAADRIKITDQHPLIDGSWQVEGEAGYWGAGVEVAIGRAGR